MKKNNTIEINGVTFQYRKGLKDRHIHYYGLSECYRNCSEQKRCAYESWLSWYNETTDSHFSSCFGIHRYNCNFFSLIMQLHYQNHIYRLWVTYRNNYIEEVY